MLIVRGSTVGIAPAGKRRSSVLNATLERNGNEGLVATSGRAHGRRSGPGGPHHASARRLKDHAEGSVSPSTRRAVGLFPWIFLNAREKCDALSKPTSIAISTIRRSVLTSR